MQQREIAVQPCAGQKLPVEQLGGRYRVTGVFQTDQVGVVYRASDVSDGGTPRLVRVWAPAIAQDAEFRARLRQRSARVTALAAQRADLVRVFDVEETAEGDLLLVGDAEEARPLGDWVLASGPLDVHESLGLAIRIGEAIESAHNAGLVHGYLAPAHIEIREPNQQIRLSGFEYGALPPRVLRQLDLDAPPFSRAHLAPDRELEEEPTESGDIYAYGCLLRDLWESGASRTSRNVGRGLVTRLWTSSRLPSGIHRTVQAMTASSPAERPRSIGEVLNDLWAQPAEEPASGAGLRGSATRHRVALSLVTLALVGGASVLAVHNGGRPPTREVSDQRSGMDDRGPAAGSLIPPATAAPATDPPAVDQPASTDSHITEDREAPGSASPMTMGPTTTSVPEAATPARASRPPDTRPPPLQARTPVDDAGVVRRQSGSRPKASVTQRESAAEPRPQSRVRVAREHLDDAAAPDPGSIIDWLLENSRAGRP